MRTSVQSESVRSVVQSESVRSVLLAAAMLTLSALAGPVNAFHPDRKLGPNREMRQVRDLERSGDNAIARGDIRGAIVLYQQALSILDNGITRVKLADALAAADLYAPALEQYRASFSSIPERDVCLKMAFSLSQLGQYEEAIALYRQGMRFEGDSGHAMLNLPFHPRRFDKRLFDAAVYVGLGALGSDRDRAISYYREALRIHPTFALAYYYWGSALSVKDPALEDQAVKDQAAKARFLLEKAKQLDRSGAAGVRAKAIEVIERLNRE